MVKRGTPDPSFPRKQLPESTDDEAIAVPETVWSVLKREEMFSLPKFEPRFLDHPSCNLGTVPTVQTVTIKFNITRLESKFYFVPNYTLQSYLNRSYIIIIIIIIIIINCNWVVTRWQWLFYIFTKYEIGY